VKLSKVKALLAAAATPISLDELDPGEPADESGFSNPINAMSANHLRRGLDQMLASLDPKSAKIMRMRFGLDGNDPRTLDEIGQLYDVTRERIRQIEAKALKNLRHPLRAVSLAGFVPDKAIQGAFVPRSRIHTAQAVELTEDDAPDTPPTDQPVSVPTDARTPSDEPMGVIHEDDEEETAVLAMVAATGSTVDDQRGSKAGVIWIRIPASSDFDHAVLGRRLLHLGFKEWPGHGYWK
jgi:RNA polymerase primary sigma factor